MDKPQCPKCKSHNVLARKSDRMTWCRLCLHEAPTEDFQQVAPKEAKDAPQ